MNDEICREPACESLATTGHYCRAHYIKNWDAIQRKKELLKDGRFERYIRELLAKYPSSVILAIMDDLASEADFEKACRDLGIFDEGGDERESLEGAEEGEEDERLAG